MLLLEQFEDLTLHPRNAARLKELVLQLAVQGKLTENWRRQNPYVEPAAELLKRIEAEKAQLVKDKKIKKEKPLEPVSENDVPYTLPEGWVWCRMQDICKLITDGTHHTPKYVDSGVPFLSVKDMSNGYLNFESTRFISEEEHKDLIKRCNPEFGDILLTKIGTTGVAINIDTQREFSIFVSVALLKINSSLLNGKFLKYLINSPLVTEQSEEGTEGVGNKNLVLRKIKSFVISLPPLAEQEAIVARVEELMRKIEELEKQTAERIQLKQHLGAAALHQLTAATDEELDQYWLFLKQHFQTMFDDAANVKKLRETILQLAVQGRLTATWRTQNPITEPASELLKRIQAEKAQLVKEKKIKKEKPLDPIVEDEVPYTLPEGWIWCRLEDLADISSGVTKGKAYKGNLVDTPYLRVANVQRGFLDLSIMKNITVSDDDYQKYQLEPFDLLMIEGGDPDKLGRCAIWQNEIEGCIYQNHVFRVRSLLKKAIDEYFLMLFINSPFTRAYYENCAKRTTNLASINKTQMRNTPIALPPLAEQEAIVAKVDQLIQLCDELEQQIQQSKQEAEALMQAVVQEALQVQEEVII